MISSKNPRKFLFCPWLPIALGWLSLTLSAAEPVSPPAEPRILTQLSGGQAGDGEQLSLKKVEFPDTYMGNVPAYSMLIPSDWTVDRGSLVWEMSILHPQPMVRVQGPAGEAILFSPMMIQMYSEFAPVQGMPQIPPHGVPPPQNVAAWLVEFMAGTNKSVSNVRLVNDIRSEELEEANRKAAQALGSTTAYQAQEVHIITVEYDSEGVTYREEMWITYSVLPMTVTQGLRSVTWAIQPGSHIRAPADRFDELRPFLLKIAMTFQPLPKWWNQMMQLRSQLVSARAEHAMEMIRARARHYDEMSDSQMASWRSRNARDDEMQRRRIQGINEVSDYRDVDGSSVELPFHYKHVYSNGNGGYLLSNKYFESNSEFQEIQSVR